MGTGTVIVSHILWTDERVSHIAKHGIQIHEVEEAIFDDPDGITKMIAASRRDSTQYLYRFLGSSTATFTMVVALRTRLQPVI